MYRAHHGEPAQGNTDCTRGGTGAGKVFCYEHRLIGSEANLLIRGTSNVDFFSFSYGSADMDAYSATPFAATARGLAGDDSLEGSRSENPIDGGSGDDTVTGTDGADHIDVGNGDRDTVDGVVVTK